jgi:hypothetical protein
MEGADRPIITPLLPVKGLRRDDKGNLTEDAVKTVMEGIKSLGIQADAQATTDALLQEARSSLCKLNAQSQFLLGALFAAVARSETVEPTLLDKLKKKNQDMQDILSVSRYILNKPAVTKEGFVEGFVPHVDSFKNYREAFETVSKEVEERNRKLQENKLLELRTYSLELSEDKQKYADRLLSMYGFLNILAVGLILYVVSS